MDDKGNALRQQMNETRAGLNDKLEELEQQVSGTVRTVKNSVNSVRDSFDVKLQVRRHPWTFVAGAAAVGFLGGIRSNRRVPERIARAEKGAPLPLSPPECIKSEMANYAKGGNGAPIAPSWLANLGEAFQPEIAELRGLVLGGLIEFVREMIAKQAARPKDRNTAGSHNGHNGKSPSPEVSTLGAIREDSDF